MNVGYFFSRYALGDQFVTQVIVQVLKRRHLKGASFFLHHLDGPLLSGSGQVAKYHLC